MAFETRTLLERDRPPGLPTYGEMDQPSLSTVPR